MARSGMHPHGIMPSGLTESAHNPHLGITRPRYNQGSFELCDVFSGLVSSAAPLARPVPADYAGALQPAHLVRVALAAAGSRAGLAAGAGAAGAGGRPDRL